MQSDYVQGIAYKVLSIQIRTSSLHSIYKSLLFGNPFDVDLDVRKWESLEVHLTPNHVRRIHKSLPFRI